MRSRAVLLVIAFWCRRSELPQPEPQALDYTIEPAKAAQRQGFKFLLDYHCADSWADPGKQPIPAAWEGLSPEVLTDSVHEYTRRTIAAFREAGAMLEMVQIGNETCNGMLRPVGKLPEDWDQFAALVKAGVDGVDAGRGQAPRPPIMVHCDKGADTAGAKACYDTLNSYNIPCDVIRLSYYPWWHGNLLGLRENLLSLTDNYDKDIILVETAYNWRPSEHQDAPVPYPETPDGQHEFLESVHETLLSVPSRQIKGIFRWESVVMKGPIYSRGTFNEEGNALPILDVFEKCKHAWPGRQTHQSRRAGHEMEERRGGRN